MGRAILTSAPGRCRTPSLRITNYNWCKNMHLYSLESFYNKICLYKNICFPFLYTLYTTSRGTGWGVLWLSSCRSCWDLGMPSRASLAAFTLTAQSVSTGPATASMLKCEQNSFYSPRMTVGTLSMHVSNIFIVTFINFLYVILRPIKRFHPLIVQRFFLAPFQAWFPVH